jgi:fucose 4-O-acetylase-like acetyltransferase
MNTLNSSREPFLDWMKFLGIALIVYGHVAQRTILYAVPPIYPKQLGVAFFVFAMGFSLAREERSWRQVAFNRLFEIYLFGLVLAFLLSAERYLTAGRLSLSNYPPFLLGANVLLPYFPANPTTWYVGTYLHLLLFWALIRNVRYGAITLAVAVVVEVIVRSVVLGTGGPYVAYMVLFNWATVFLLGMWYGRRIKRRSQAPGGLASSLMLLLALAVWWPFAANRIPANQDFPFRLLQVGGGWIDLAATSASISFVYLAYTWCVFQVTRRLPDARPAAFFARNTLLVFLAHMPIYSWMLRQSFWPQNYAARVAIQFFICFVLLAIASELVLRLIKPKDLRVRAYRLLANASVARVTAADRAKASADAI